MLFRSISGGSGDGGIATALIGVGALGPVAITTGGVGYSTVPQVTIQKAFGSFGPVPFDMEFPIDPRNARAEAVLNTNGVVTAVRYSNAGTGYTSAPSISFSDPTATSYGDYTYNEVVTGTKTGTTGYVKSWDGNNRVLKVSIVDGNFSLGEGLVGAAASYRILSVEGNEFLDPYAENVQIEKEADSIVDFSQKNPFGEY